MRNGWLPTVLALAVFAITQVPFWLGDRWAPEGTVYDGLVGMVDDQNMYFSFIRQAAEGDWLFVNRLTHVEHQPALFNVEWLAVGRLMHGLGDSQAGAYAIWRAVGVLLLIFGFWALAGRVLADSFQRRLALLLCAFGGGFGWIFLVLERAGALQEYPALTLDLSEALHPFSHLFANPHLSVSHGLSLWFLAAFVAGEQTGRPRCYLAAGAIAVLHALIRPYDLILIYGILPAYILVEWAATRTWSWRTTALRLVPLAATAPVLLYYVALFQFHPVFKYWSSQGNVAAPGLPWHLLSFGAAGVLCAARLCLVRRYPLQPAERLLLVWIGGVLFLIHGKSLPGLRFLPFAPVFGVTLASAMLIVGVRVVSSEALYPHGRLAWGRTALFAAVTSACCLSSAVWILKVCHNLRSFRDHYIPAAEYAAFRWLNENAGRSDVVLSTLPSGNRMAKYVSARFALGHRFVTPHAQEIAGRVDRFLAGQMSSAEANGLLSDLNVRWIYVGAPERSAATGTTGFHPGEIPGVAERLDARDARVLSFEPTASGP